MSLAPISRIGQRLGAWQVVQRIGEGGTASVYVVVREDGTRAALKVLRPSAADEEHVRHRFRREAYLANKVDHPGVVRVLEDGETPEGVPYLVMELLEGETLETRRTRKGGFLPVPEVLWIADETLSVLIAAHEKGIVHRDIKPENLFLTRDARIRVLDFGIARLHGEDTFTRAGTVIGTLGFMAPEQARGETGEVGTAADIWAVGATMFTLLSGRMVRADDTLEALLDAARKGVESIADAAPGVPEPIVGLVDAALSFDPAIRWPSAALMRRALHVTYAEMSAAAARHTPHGDRSDPSFDLMNMPTSIDAPPMSIHRTQVPPRPTTVPPPRPALSVLPQRSIAGETTFRIPRERRARQAWWRGWTMIAAIVIALLIALAALALYSGVWTTASTLFPSGSRTNAPK
jgi:serine/threonine protein kinase